MASESKPSEPVPQGSGNFAPTQWSVVLGSRPDAAGRREALERLCRIYWRPVYVYLRRRGQPAADAEDLTQGFFEYILDGSFLERPDPAKGRFRGYLIGTLKHYLGSQLERESAQKRGGAITFIDWGGLDADTELSALGSAPADPVDAYEQAWALALLGRALARLEQEQAAIGKDAHFAILKPFLSSTPSRGDYARCADLMGTTRSYVAVAVHRLNQRYGELVRLEVAETVNNRADVAAEMQHLAQVLRT